MNQDQNNAKSSIFKLSFIKNTKENFALAKQFHNEAIEKSKEITIPNEDIALSFQHITKIFRTISGMPIRILNDVSFEVKKGEFHGFIGNNGAGKTTTIRTLLDYHQAWYGKIFINGIDSRDVKSKEKIGYIPEISIFPKNLTIFEYLYYFARMSKIPKKAAIDKVNKMLEKYGFNKKEFNKSAEKLSSGQKKKINLIQALINDPEILIMDEPAANLDPSARIEFYEAIKELHNEGKTILISSHILAELEKYIDSVTVLEKGTVKDSGKVEEKLKNKVYNYKIKCTDLPKLQSLLVDKKIKSLISDDSLLLKLSSEKQKLLIFQVAFDNKIQISFFGENKMSLNKIYFNAANAE
ncbi:ABC transporter ATP-binding protein [Metamycoplasma arthritidis]|uniref:ABC transporter ATP-binding protein n=1 Tax=Metamycoplasma arthritidis (strain 158L3-1) TaxID=243272 RepID=B3PN06_META1|nr:ABC transporter ATP-binding protein [Metamycoplasma arthritidis]ACF07408.1 ABC transporter ATP-binding protein [Metamycoplasma arthritidis 158L3-1]VEU78930.1 ABC transporter ATP-binding protein [Metamycoplasma arthritidis]